MHGTADSIVAPEASEELHSRATATDKTYKIYEGALHGLLCEELPLRATIESVRKTDCFADILQIFD
jgi:alpha-beta hydrolase superfamily lysophospholipase